MLLPMSTFTSDDDDPVAVEEPVSIDDIRKLEESPINDLDDEDSGLSDFDFTGDDELPFTDEEEAD